MNQNFQLLGNKLFKFDLDDQTELLWNKGGVPYIDIEMWDKYKTLIEKIIIRTKQGRYFKTSADDFNKFKKKIKINYDFYYYLDKDKWEFREAKPIKDISENETNDDFTNEIARLFGGKIINKDIKDISEYNQLVDK